MNNKETLPPVSFCPYQVIADNLSLFSQKNEAEFCLKKFLVSMEKELIKKAYKDSHGNKTQAALTLGMNRTTLVMRMKVLGLSK